MSVSDQWTVNEPWLDLHCALAEGPFFEAESKTVRFVDIKKKQIHTVSLSQGMPSLKTIQLDICPTVTADIAGVDPHDKILLGVKYGVAVLDRSTGHYELIARFSEPHNERLRSNDGAADPQGRFWLGSMTDFGLGEFQPEGALSCFTGSGGQEQLVAGLTIPNSVGWAPDNRTMYFTHSKTREIFAWDYDVSAGGTLSGKRLFYQHPTSGEPDGFRIDRDGNLCSAVYGEGRVLKINPKGELVGEVRLPTRNITCVQFAGTELIITSAADDAADAEPRSRALGGAVFRVDVGTTGLDLFKFSMQG
ncbi:calcium homeostasis protein regucalcin [Purpureocillium lavendulum]|uniref:Calcium homeostasis protein regucalcin n=1 Tax=Purpureocillium lavendulum TaxID=1247861 RepID=A0AB34G5I3_9HYPO|nr:calcium homeostasis protein regucalcin [Purpureocillium lavendulum]